MKYIREGWYHRYCLVQYRCSDHPWFHDDWIVPVVYGDIRKYRFIPFQRYGINNCSVVWCKKIQNQIEALKGSCRQWLKLFHDVPADSAVTCGCEMRTKIRRLREVQANDPENEAIIAGYIRISSHL
jgi:hypothetical protein